MMSSRRGGNAPDEALSVGVVGRRYSVQGTIGCGGMCLVGAAEHIGLQTPVAIKLLRAELARDRVASSRFLREARALACLRSEHAARVFDVGELDSGQPYMVMELLDGQDLGAVLARTGPMRVPDAVECVLHACEALAEAHALGMTHRDIKPENMFLTHRADGTPLLKLIDFGVATAMPGSEVQGPAGARLTRASRTFGTPS